MKISVSNDVVEKIRKVGKATIRIVSKKDYLDHIRPTVISSPPVVSVIETVESNRIQDEGAEEVLVPV